MKEDIHVCPPWVGKLMASPLRKLYQSPQKILGQYIEPGYNVLEIGPGMGFFSLPMAKMVGESGKVYCVDIQEVMLENLARRALRSGVQNQIDIIVSDSNTFNIKHLNNRIDFGFLFAVVHEVPDKQLLFNELAAVIKNGGHVLFAEPKGHVSEESWNNSLKIAQKMGFNVIENLTIKGSIAALLRLDN